MKVLGTNPLLMPLLHINPFSFPESIHVLEHIDRLVEIFNACWPMYAAMPAVLKDAIEQCYVQKGWDLNCSICEPREFPVFFDLLDILPKIMNESLYSADTKSDYAGALITRVKSLTNGINGQVFCSNKDVMAENKELFDENVIIDLSRVGSMETKSLLMGILIMKLQEYRMHMGGMNEHLSHVTVLEEAHNLLRKTSDPQTQESSNLQGKSVEMISNAIAEMRTYGEGFIIVDQAPALLDESVIRNTNTKIVLRLPNEADRLLVGKSEALTDNQMGELAKLPQGVAAVYQNDWVEAVLCKFPEFPQDKKKPCNPFARVNTGKILRKYFGVLFEVSENKELTKEEVDYIRNWTGTIRCSKTTKALFEKTLDGEKLSEREQCMIAYNVFAGKRMAGILEENSDEKKGIDLVRKSVKSMHGINDTIIAEQVLQLNLKVLSQEASGSNLVKRYRKFERMGREQSCLVK